MTEPRCSHLLWQFICGWQFSVVLDGDASEHFPYKVQLAYMARIGKSNWLFTDFFFKFPLKISDVKNTLNKHD